MNNKKFGTAPVFFTAISTILGAILFLRFGVAVGSIGFWGAIAIILLGHLVTIPTALAISELATNKRVEGGGEYFIISRSFGLNIGATIGIALYLSQAISVAFYVIAFTEAFEFVFDFMNKGYGIELPRQVISLPAMLFLAILIFKKGANVGVKALYFVIGILFLSLILFFFGTTDYGVNSSFSLKIAEFRNMDQFFVVFAIIFPAFTGMTAGVGLSGDLKKPSKSIPLGTLAATIIGMIIYFFIVYKLAAFASVEDLQNNQLIMAKIAIGGAIVIPFGLAASTISSALGSIMVAPRTLQALANDLSFPSKKLNQWLSSERSKDSEPINATLITTIIAVIFVALGDVNAVAEIISMFFMVTYGALCLISFLYHFGSSPSYRPSFKSRWYISLIGFTASIWIMFKINLVYALAALILMTLLYLFMKYYHKNRRGLETIFLNSIFQLSRNLQVYLQKKIKKAPEKEWRPSAICISENTLKQNKAFELLNWISFKYGFGTYIHLLKGYYSKATVNQSRDVLKALINKFEHTENHVYIDTLISPSFTSAIAQTIQVPGIAGMENNMVIFEFEKESPSFLPEIIENLGLVSAGKFDICIVGSSTKVIKNKNDIHVWISSIDEENSNLMIMLSFIITGHPKWRKSNIKIFETCKPEKVEAMKIKMKELVENGRLPITQKNIEIIPVYEGTNIKSLINNKSSEAELTIIGFKHNYLKNNDISFFTDFNEIGTILFVNSSKQIEI